MKQAKRKMKVEKTRIMVERFTDKSDEFSEQVIDVLTDLRLMCAELDYDFDDLSRISSDHFHEEVE